ncbi:MAG: DUF72 domain-containing protein [Candidatus Delongbacteria bacterium]|nr:DUF72 domain-containing protein [Candidatus Delongbacteria bacterium]
MANEHQIHVGTSGYSFPDWHGVFYPPEIPKTKMLDYYQYHFKTVEINSTYYRIPPITIMQRIEQKTSPDFRFMVKLPGQYSHARTIESNEHQSFVRCLEPMKIQGKLKGLLSQFPFSFKHSQVNIKYLKHLKTLFPDDPLFIEFRHVSWNRNEVIEFLKSENLGYVTVDAPRLDGLFPFRPDLTNGTAYFRLHGRNPDNWWDTSQGDRYDYNYTEPEIKDMVAPIKHLQEYGNVYVFFNNCHAGQAILNAELLKQVLGLDL